ncbi:ATP-binding protein [Paucidesulfovibrio longus]|uniref:ATP-binding protein n=1 Tax=Paucidesulfovibrio longus TaxID=889 RepID=UPI0003B507A2|nr:ATP-binding protein [Paucidesulfovibrio longus]
MADTPHSPDAESSLIAGESLMPEDCAPDRAAPLAESVACLWEEGERVFRVGVVGTGPGFMALLDLAFNPRFHDFLPPVEVVGVARPGVNPAKLDYARSKGVPVYADLETLHREHPELNMLVDLTGERAALRQARSLLGEEVSLVDQDAAIFICGMHDMAKANTSSQDDLDRQRHLLQAIVDEIREDVMLLDLEGRVVDMNRNVWRRTGHTKEQLLGKHCWEVLTKRDGKPFCVRYDPACPLRRSIETRTKDEALFTRVSAGGRLLYYRIYSYPIFNRAGALSHVMMMHRDITARTHREQSLQQTEKLALIGEMSTYLAHEIRNPLCAIGGFTHALLRSPNLSEKELEKVRIIAEETQRLDQMLSNILNFSKPGKPPQGEVDMVELVSGTVELMKVGYESVGYEFVFEAESELPRVRGDAESIKQCLVNMIKNSLEAMSGGGRIRVCLTREFDFVRLGVEDNGAGMSEAEQDKAFSPFYTTKAGGTGLGLPMIKKLVEEMGGHIDLRSSPGSGTGIYLYFRPVLAGVPLKDGRTPH